MRPPALRSFLRASAAATLVLAATLSMSRAAAQEAWPMAGHDPAHSGSIQGPEAPFSEAWSADVGGGPIAGVAVTDEVAVALGAEEIVALDPTSGEVLWEEPRYEGPAGVPAIAGDLVVYSSSSGPTSQLVARDIDDGKLAWLTLLGSRLSAPTVSDKTVLIGTGDGQVVALDAGTGVVKWRFETNGAVSAAPAVAEDTVVAAGYESSTGTTIVYGIDSETGAEDGPKWQLNLGAIGSPSPPGIADGKVYIGTNDLYVRAIDLEEGTELWKSRVRDGFGPKQVPAAGEALVLADQTNAFRLDPETGDVIWNFRLADLRALGDDRFNTLVASAPAVSVGTVLVGNGAGTLSGIDTESGHRIWRTDLGEGAVGPVAASGDLVYAVTLGEDGAVTALENDPSGQLTDEISSTELFWGEALLNFAAAALAVGVLILLIFRFALRPRSEKK